MRKFTNVLLIEDDPITIMVCDRIMKMTGFAEQVQSKENGQEAIKYIQSIIEDQTTFPEIIFLDINMPVMNGWEFIEAYEALGIEHKVDMYILSSSVYENDIEKTKGYKAVKGFISKPLSMERLTELVNAIRF